MKRHSLPCHHPAVFTRSENLLDWFGHLRPQVQIALLLCMTTILVLLVFNPVAGGALVSFLLALRGIKDVPTHSQ